MISIIDNVTDLIQMFLVRESNGHFNYGVFNVKIAKFGVGVATVLSVA